MNAYAHAAVTLQPGNSEGETVHCFGEGLVGVLSRPADAAAQPVALILFNAGLVHRAGPYHGHTQLARVLAQRGFAVLRLDQSGLGDSAVSRAASDVREAEMQAAMDLLQAQTGANRFVLGGICAGADHVFHLAQNQPRVAGLLMIDGWAYRTPGFWLRYLPSRIFNPVKLLRWLRNRGGAAAVEVPSEQDLRDFPTREQAQRRLQELVAADCKLWFLFTGGVAGYFNYAGQLADSLGPAARAPQVDVEYWPDCDHTFYLRRDRKRMQEAVAAWMTARFGIESRA